MEQTAEAEALAVIGKTATAADPMHEEFSEEELILLMAAADKGEIMKQHNSPAASCGECTRERFNRSDRPMD